MSTTIALQQQQKDPNSGHVDTLTIEQEELLRKFWTLFLNLLSPENDENLTYSNGDALKFESTKLKPNSTSSSKSSKVGTFLNGGSSKKSLNSEGGISGDTNGTTSYQPKPTSRPSSKKEIKDDKYNESGELNAALELYTPGELRTAAWRLSGADDPDLIFLRFLRARKWDVHKALAMLVSTLKWSLQIGVSSILALGEPGLENYFAQKNLPGFRAQLELGKNYCRGTDREGRPICFINVRFHKKDDQSLEVTQRFTIWVMETVRLMIEPPVETACLVFNMAGSGLQNMDLQGVKFMIQCFEAYYPESLGICIVHKAPWVFQSVWRIISTLLDPVVASKIHFTRDDKDLLEFIEPDHLMSNFGGQDPWEYKYIPSTEEENERMNDVATKEEKLKVREQLVRNFEELTRRWIDEKFNKELKKERDETKIKLRRATLELDPYVRARTYYHRIGVLREDGTCDWGYSDRQK
ncbi:hypothetical protein G9A89_007978 [Geosiphon pyriformis]|nr:hypothetical protein G9A89_007978 [Geosiphon pyriformis]